MKVRFFVFFISALIVLSCKTEKKTRPNTKIPPKYSINSEPEFKKQGDLIFISQTDTLAQIEIEIADNEKKRETGLMYRKHLKEEQGMLFIFEHEKRRSFWMKQTHIPLDIIFINNEKTIVHIAKNCKPYSLDPIASFEYANYVVEVNASFCSKHDIKVGSKIEFTIKQ